MSASTASTFRESETSTAIVDRVVENDRERFEAARLAAETELKPSVGGATGLNVKPDSTSATPIAPPRGFPPVLLAEWSGCVARVETHFFTAALKGIRGEGVRGEEEDAEIPVSDVAPADLPLLQAGNFFRLCVFYETREDERPRRYTQVVFRRLPAYRAVDLANAAGRAAERHRALRVE